MITCELIAGSVSDHYGLPAREVFSRDRHPDLVIARHMGWRLASRLTRLSHPAIGRAMGGQRGPAVIRGILSLEHKMRVEPDIAADAKVLNLGIAAKDTDIGASVTLPISVPEGLPLLNPLAVAEAVLGEPLRDLKVPAEWVRCLALGVRAYFGELQQLRDNVGGYREKLAATPNAILHRLAQDAAIASHDLDSAIGSRGEKPARNHLNKTLNALRNHFAQEKQNA